MRTFRFHSLVTACALMMTAHAEPSHVLRFLNGDELPGTPGKVDLETILWNSPALLEPGRFHAEQVRHVQLPSKIHIPEAAGHEATLTLTNGDVLRGQLASVTDDEVTFDTWYAGRMVFRRVMVRDLSVREMPDYFYRGPIEIDSWKQTTDPPAWTNTEDGGMQSAAPGGIGNEMDLPEEFVLEFDAQWTGSFRLHVILFTNDLSTESPDEGYEVVFQRQSVHIRRCGQRQWIGHSNRAIELQQNEKARIRLQASLRTGQFAFFVNDRIIDAWTDNEVDPEKLGNGIQFISRDNSPLIISRIDLSRWDGTLEDVPEAGPMIGGLGGFGGRFDFDDAEEEEDEQPNGMTLRNGDRIQGTVSAIEDGLITIDTAFREITIPVERLRTIALKPVDLEEPKREIGDIRAWFSDGGSIVFRLEGISDDGAAVHGSSQTFGSATFDLSAFQRLEFNIYDLFRREL